MKIVAELWLTVCRSLSVMWGVFAFGCVDLRNWLWQA